MQAFCFPVNCGPLKYGSLQQKLELKVSALAVDERAQWLFSASKDNALKARRPEKAPGPKPKESDGRRSTTWSGPAFLHLLWLCRAGTLGGRQMMQCETHSPTPTTSMHFEEAGA